MTYKINTNGLKVKETNINLPDKYNFNLILLFVKKLYIPMHKS